MEKQLFKQKMESQTDNALSASGFDAEGVLGVVSPTFQLFTSGTEILPDSPTKSLQKECKASPQNDTVKGSQVKETEEIDEAGFEQKAGVMGEAAFQTQTENSPIQMEIASGATITQLTKERKKKKKKKKKGLNETEMELPESWVIKHTQNEIQLYIMELWLKNTRDEQDELRAKYMYENRAIECGWCDGWSYVVSKGGENLPIIWEEIDKAIEKKIDPEDIDQDIINDAIELARGASHYHMINNPNPEPPENHKEYESEMARYNKYIEAGYFFEARALSEKNWTENFGGPLDLDDIRGYTVNLKRGQTLRLTSPGHEGAIKRFENGYIVVETELHGVLKCNQIKEVISIIEKYKIHCEKEKVKFFNEFMFC